MEKMHHSGGPMFRLWMATYSDWRPTHWNQSPPRATALELVEDALYSADEAALFLEGFNSSMLGDARPIWAVAVPITVCYEGDARPGRPIDGHVFPLDALAPGSHDREDDAGLPSPLARSMDVDSPPGVGNQSHGFGQSPQRSR